MAFSSFSKKIKQTGVDDMVLLPGKATHDDVNENLKKRHANETYISDVLIAMNPYKLIQGLYTPDQIENYRGKYRHESPPHVYALAEEAYRNMVNQLESQCVIISGESGAGKTETSKLIMQFIAAVSGKGEGVEKVKRVILESNPLLEAFGNAKTLRNNNSSRFGKYFEIQFDKKGDPVGGKITNYLLEKSRVTFQSKGERNFHIFYQLCAGADKQQREQYGVTEPGDFYYLSQSGCLTIENVNDADEFKETTQAMDAIGLTKQEQTSIMKMLAGILWLGNITFSADGDKCAIDETGAMDWVTFLLAIDKDAITRALSYRVIQTGQGGRRGTTYNVPQSPDQAAGIRDALAKALYDRLFSWLVLRINAAMVSKTKDVVIGVLDIYGFEIFENNSFEQFCINYVNEKLQQIFIDLTLAQEEAEYKAEGIKFEPIKYFNNKIVCDLIEETKPPGIFAILDDVCHTTHSMEAPKADEKFLQKIEGVVNNPHFVSRGDSFIVKHYAGPVIYNIYGFTEKNKDQLYNTLIDCMVTSKDPFIAAFFKEDAANQNSKKPTTAGYKIKKSCLELVETLKKCTPHYIRCIKPNDNKSPKEFDTKRMLHQVQYLGLLENIKVRRSGFAYRTVFEKFLERFEILSKKTWPVPWKGDSKSGCKALLEDLNLEAGVWQLGVSKVFLKHPETLFSMEEMKERKYHNAATLIARTFQNYKLRAYYADLRSSATNLLEAKKERRRLSINRIYTGDYINYLNNAQILEIMKSHVKSDGGVLFADMFEYAVPPMLFGKHSVHKMYGLVTKKALYFLERVKVKKQYLMQLKKRIAWEGLGEMRLSVLADNWVGIGLPSEPEEFFVECNNKTEFLTVLNDQYKAVMKKDITRVFANQFDYFITKGKKRICTFQKDEKFKLPNLTTASSKWVVQVATGLAPETRPREIKRPEKKPQQPKSTTPAQKQQPKAAPTGLVSHAMEQAPAPPTVHYESDAAPAPQKQPSAPAPVKKVEQQPKAAPAPTTTTTTTPAPQKQPAAPAPVKKAAPPPPSKDTRPKAKVVFDYDATAADELTIKEGQIVTIVTKDASGWWRVICNGKEGLIPGNYTEQM